MTGTDSYELIVDNPENECNQKRNIPFTKAIFTHGFFLYCNYSLLPTCHPKT
jgi:hypothetical protein